MKTFVLFCLVFCFSSVQLIAQCGNPDVYCMDSSLEYTCQGTFMDAGGSDIYPAESSTITLCPDVEANKTSITFSEFDLYGSVNDPYSDQMIIFDGTSENDPLIGIYTGYDLLGMTISASNGNPGGCLMIQFISGGLPNTYYTGWVGEISCSQSCIPPQAVASVPDAQVESSIFLSCLYDEITLSGAGSTAAPGQSIVSYVWDMKDGNVVTSATEDIVHLYENAAIYDVRLVVLDDLGCAGETIIHVGMVGAPTLDITDASAVCVGTDLSLEASFTPSSINNAPQLNNNIALFVPDDQTQSFQTEIMVTGYQAGATVNSCDDLLSVYVNMEHSFMGDLVIQLICPNGQSVNLHEQGGSGTYLGEPVDDDLTTQGVGYDYSWSDSSVLGTWADNGIGGSLPPGAYNPVQPLCNLIGCPMNGLWSLNILDLFAVDNGYVFSWGLGMSVGNNVDALEYTTTIGIDAASSYWSGADVLSADANADIAQINTSESGTLQLDYTTIDNIGCVYTESADLEVIVNPINVLLDDYFNYGANNTYMYATTDGTVSDYQLDWVWTPADGLDNPNSYYTGVLIPNDNAAYTVTATSDELIGCSDSETIAMTLPELVISGHIFYDENQNGVFDIGENPLSYFPFVMNNNGMNSFSDQAGYYTAYCTYGENTVTINADPALWIVTTPSSFTTVLNDGQLESLNNDFGIYPSSNPQVILNGGISNSNTWCIFNDLQTITVSNDGNTVESGYIVYTYDPLCSVVSTNPAPFNIDGNNLYFAFNDLLFSSTVSFEVVLDLPDTSEPGDWLDFSTQTFYYDGDVAVAVETDALVTSIQCSYDPNDKREMNGVGEMGMIAPNSSHDYVIRFQNTGTAPAMDVVITDQLSSSLDFATLDPVVSSHPFTATVTPAGLATFHFDNILLPDSGSNFDGSIGFIHFRIQQMPDLPLGTIIHNEAAIYFDANAPVITNTTINTVMQCTGDPLQTTLNENEIEILDLVSDVHWYMDGTLLPNVGYVLVANQTGSYYATATLVSGCPATSETFLITTVREMASADFDVFPNPANSLLNIALPDGIFEINMYNQLGQQVLFKMNAASLYQLEVHALPRGSYTLRISNEQEVRHVKVVLN